MNLVYYLKFGKILSSWSTNVKKYPDKTVALLFLVFPRNYEKQLEVASNDNNSNLNNFQSLGVNI